MAIMTEVLETAAASAMLLGQSSAEAQQGLLSATLWLLLIVALVTIGSVLVLALRKKLRSDDDVPGVGISLADLRGLRDRGEIDEGEFKALRDTLIEKMGSGENRS